ncbi:MAG: XdhC family protein [Cyclobacteriaceae bacterium]
MQDILAGIEEWLTKEEDFVLATVIGTWGSGPRKVGAGMAINKEGEIIGSVSGGCVEGDVVKQSKKVLESGEPTVLNYGIADEEAWEVGLSCGGKLDVLLRQVDRNERSVLSQLINYLSDDIGAVVISSISQKAGSEILRQSTTVSSPFEEAANKAYHERKSQQITVEGIDYFLNVFPSKSKLVIVGAAHISSELVEIASMHDFETIVIDPRGLFSSKSQFKIKPSKAYQKWPAEVLKEMDLNSDVYAVLLTHDPKIDDQALHTLLRSGVNYIGALGSRKTHAKRVARLTDEGFGDKEIDRIHAPIGIDINAKIPKEIALSIVAELLKIRNHHL